MKLIFRRGPLGCALDGLIVAIESAIRTAVEEEREACAKCAESFGEIHEPDDVAQRGDDIAACIRARSMGEHE